MRGLRKISAVILLGFSGVIWAPHASFANGATPSPLTLQFAGCVGRLSAQMEHQWLLSDPDADRTEAQRAAMVALLDATSERGTGPEVLAYRIAAKHAQAGLLTQATFGTDQHRATWALTRAQTEVSACLGYLLS